MTASLQERRWSIYEWYAGEPRFLSPDYLATIAWEDIRRHEFESEFVSVLYYMRDGEKLTDRYFSELKKTPTGSNPAVAVFMERRSRKDSIKFFDGHVSAIIKRLPGFADCATMTAAVAASAL